MSERSKAAFEALVQELWAWRKQNKTANFRTIEERVEQEIAKLRAVMLSELAQESTATSGETEEGEVVRCPKCGGRCQRHGRQQRKLTGRGGAEVELKRQKMVCQACGHSFFPSG